MNTKGDPEYDSDKYPVGLLTVTDVDDEKETFRGRWWSKTWKGFDPPPNWSYQKFRLENGRGERYEDPREMSFDSLIRGVTLKWNQPEARGERVVLSKPSTDEMIRHLVACKIVNAP